MKKKIYYTSFVRWQWARSAVATIFLNKDPQDKQTNDTYWQTETSLRTYAQVLLFFLLYRIWYRLYLFLPVISLEMTIRVILSI